MRGDQLSRQWRVLRQLEVSKQGITANKIAELSGTSLRTAYRDLDDLQLAGFPLYSETRDGCQCWKFIDTYQSNLPFPFTYTELMSLHISRDLFKIFKGTVFFESLESLFDKVIASLSPETIFGLAIGDALDRPTEFMSLKNIQSKYGPEGIQDLPEQALYTDDTQMTMAIAEASIKAGDQDLETIMDAVRDAFISWRHSPENNRAPGNACLTGVSNMEKGIHSCPISA